MWCSHCNKETASVPTRTGDGVCCALCGENYFREKPSDETIREAREIIAKWSSSDLLDQISTLPQIPTLSERYTAQSSLTDTPAEPEPEALTAPFKKTISTARPIDTVDSDSAKTTASQEPELTLVERSDNRTEPKSFVNTSSHTNVVLPEKVTAEVSSVAVPTPEPIPSATKVSDRVEQPDPQPRKMLPRKPQSRQQRQRVQPTVAKDQGMKPMSRKLRVDTTDGEQPELPPEQPTNVAGGKIQSNSTPGSRRRIDTGEPLSNVLDTGSRRARTQGRPRQRYIDEAHDAATRGPHFEVVPQRRSNLTSVTGQFLAYLGVLGLTIGTAMVIYGHFGGYSQYTPTGWLVTTVAQMMLFLGVINLVSGGMEQTNTDVSQRMEYLGAQLMRIEQVTEEALRGPKIPAHRYANPDATVEEHDHAHASLADD